MTFIGTSPREIVVKLPRPHLRQAEFIDSPAKRKVIRAGRRGGKTIGIAIHAVREFLKGRRVLYAAPTQDQIESFWHAVIASLWDAIEAGIYYKNETKHIIERLGTKQRIRAKTAWNADTLRGDFADLLILDEWQLMNEDAWGVVGAPMLMDNNGDAVFIYTPPSLRSRSASKATDPQHAAKLYKAHQNDPTGRWATFSFPSSENPHLPEDAIAEIASDMTAIAYRMEILAQDVDESPGALWTRQIIESNRHKGETPDFDRIVVAVDPSATANGDEAGIITAGRSGDGFYPIADDSVQGSPQVWASRAVNALRDHGADYIVAESNNGGEMVELTIHTIDPSVKVKLVHASRGKSTRAEPISALYEHGRGHHIGHFPALEDELCLWMPGDASPNRLDALVWAGTELMLGSARLELSSNPFYGDQ